MLIDFHTHAFPEKIAERAIEKLSFASGGLTPHTNGTFFDLKQLFKASKIDKAVVLSIATNAATPKIHKAGIKRLFLSFISLPPFRPLRRRRSPCRRRRRRDRPRSQSPSCGACWS